MTVRDEIRNEMEENIPRKISALLRVVRSSLYFLLSSSKPDYDDDDEIICGRVKMLPC